MAEEFNAIAEDLSSKQRRLLELMREQKRRQRSTERRQERSIPRRAPGEEAVLSYGQQRLWFIEQLEPGTAAYHVPGAVRMKGRLDREALVHSLAEVGRRHENLRTCFRVEAGEPKLHIEAEPPTELLERDIRHLPDSELEAEAARLVDEAVLTPFDLSRTPLYRTVLIRLRDDEHIFLLILHHIISDIWSVGVFLRNVTASYDALVAGEASPLSELPIQYTDYAAWQREVLQGESLEGLLSFWKGHLEGAPTVLDLTTDHPRPATQSFSGGRRYMNLGVPLTESLKAVAKAGEASLYMLLLAALDTILFRYTGQRSILVGVPMANRNRVELEGLVGLLFNQLVVRADLEGRMTFRQLLAQVRESLLAVFNHQDLPFEQLVEELDVERDMSRNPIYQVLFAYQNVPTSRMAVRGLELSRYEVRETTSREDLELDMRETPEGLAGWFGYDAALFDATTIERMRRHFRNLLEGIAVGPESTLADLPLLAVAERQQLLVEWNDASSGDPLLDTFPALFEARVREAPDAPAVGFEGRTLTYGELDGCASAVARRLVEWGVAPGTVVALLAERGLDLWVTVLGVWKAGGAYLPLDPIHPPHRHAQVLRQSRAPLALAAPSLLPVLEAALGSLAAGERPRQRVMPEATGGAAGGKVAPDPAPEDLAYVIYTSGSTGIPKGAMVVQRGMLNHLLAKVEDLGLGTTDVVAQTASQCFDISVWQLAAALICGGCVQIYEDEIAHEPARLLERTEADGVTVLEVVPSVLRLLVEEAERRGEARPGLARLRWMIPTGEALPPELAHRWHLAYPRIPLINAYGPTECSDDVTHYPMRRRPPRKVSRVSIGRPVRDTQIYVSDPALEPVPMGVPGELYVAGAGVGRGYLDDPRRTAEAFLPDPLAGVPGGRVYRSGDRARWRADGNLDFLGRIDHQVKVRGFRIELGEIETALAGMEGVRQAVVMAREVGASEQALVAYVVEEGLGEGRQDGDLRRRQDEIVSFLKGRLPEYMVPSGFVFLDQLPLSPNGKVDRKALLAERVSVESRADYLAPRTEVEEKLVRIWCSVLGLDRVGVRDNFFDVGGQSLLATQLVSRIRETFGVEVPVRVIFQEPELASLAESVETALLGGGRQRELPLERIPRDGHLRPSFGQERFWFIDKWRPNLTAYNIFGAVRMRGLLSFETLQRSFEELLRRHEVLRTTFDEADGRPVQMVGAVVSLPIPLVDLQGVEPSRRYHHALTVGNTWAQHPFDLANGPLIRAALLRLDEEDHILAVTAHHIVYDVWSREILVRELGVLYEAFWHRRPSPLAELPIQYADFAHWQRQWMESAAMEEQMEFWRQRLEGVGSGTELPGDRPRPAVQSFRGTRTALDLTPEVTEGLKEISRRQGVTLFMTLLAGFAAFLHRYTAERNVVFGSPIANRNRGETESLIGFLVNTLVLRVGLSGEPSFRELMDRAREVALGAYSNQDLPFELLVNELKPPRDAARQPFFQILFNFMTNYQPIYMELPELTLTPEPNHSGAVQFDMILSMYEVEGRLHFSTDYSTDLYDPSTMQRYLRQLAHLLEDAIADPDRPFHRLSVWSPAERQQVLVEWNDTVAPFPDVCLHDLVAAQAQRTPESIALRFDGAVLSYGALISEATRMAARLVALGVGPGTYVGICAQRSLELVVALLAVLEAGGAYIPLDPDLPKERLAGMVQDARPAALLIAPQVGDGLPTTELSTPVVWFGDEPAVGETADPGGSGKPAAAPLAPRVGAADPVYMIFTSGSTGRPKGAVNTHAALVNRLWWMQEIFRLGPTDRVLQKTPFSFDVSVWEFFWPLLVGAELVIAVPDGHRDTAYLAELIELEGVTTLHFVPSMLAAFLDEPSIDPCRSVERVIASGEALPADLVERFYHRMTGHLFNLYGPTEAAIDVTWWPCKRDPAEGVIPIGRPVFNTGIEILDEDLQPVPIGVTGELHITGAQVGSGYPDQPRLTAQRFVPHASSPEPGARSYRTGDLARFAPTGEIQFLGRVDHQVKIRGLRIELGEIESVLSRHSDLISAAVLVRRSPSGDPRLVAYLVAKPPVSKDPTRLRAFLKESLPDYMIPAVFVFLEALPLSTSGKVDRRALAALEVEEVSLQAPYVAPRNEVEQTLARMWSELLGVERVGAFDNFFDLGGHSLLTTQLVSRLRGAFQLEVSLPTFFEDPTVAGLADAIELARWADEVARQEAEPEKAEEEAASEEVMEMELGEI